MSHINSAGIDGGIPGVIVLNVKLIAFPTTPYTILPTDDFIGVDTTGGAVTIWFPENPQIGRTYIIKDVGGAAATNNITIESIFDDDYFDNVLGSYVMDTAYQSVSIIYTSPSHYYIY